MDTFTYTMDCGHRHVSAFRRTEGATVRCTTQFCRRLSKLTGGDFAELLGTQADRDRGYRETPVYTVWRRHPDGYVNADAGPGSAPRGWNEITFEVLLVTDEWIAAHARIRAERVADEMNATVR